jgi:hypothetical protein
MHSKEPDFHIGKLLAEISLDVHPDSMYCRPVCCYFPKASVFSVPENVLRSGFFDSKSWRVFVENEFWRKITASHLELRELFPTFRDMLQRGKCSLCGFSLNSVLGHGTNAAVYLTADGFALKVVSGSKAPKLRSEFELLQHVRHDNIVSVYGFFPMHGGAAMLMERIFPDTAVLSHYRSGLAEVHRHGYSHGDIRRSNIGTDCNGNGKLFDFGNSSVLTPGQADLELKHLSLLFDSTTDEQKEFPEKRKDTN